LAEADDLPRSGQARDGQNAEFLNQCTQLQLPKLQKMNTRDKETTGNNRSGKGAALNRRVPNYKADLEKMRQKAAEFKSHGDHLGLVMADALIRGMRDIGYKNTAFAVFELIDNSIQSGAQKVCIELRNGGNGPEVTELVVMDDGHGMPPEWLRFAVRWGGTHREKLEDRTGFGRYGYGLKSSCISYGRRLQILTRTEDSSGWSSVYIDLDEIARGGFRDDKGNLIAPEPKAHAPSGWVADILKERLGSTTQGSIVVVSKIDLDRLTYTKAPKLKDFLIRHLGVTYRNYLRSVDICVGDTKVEPIDPLFITPGFKFHDEDEDRAEALPPLVLDVKTADKKEIAGQVRVRFSYMPPTFGRTPEDKDKADGRGTKQNSRFKIRLDNNGVIVLRAGRQIDVVDSKCPWFKFQNNDKYIGVELDFDPVLDEEFHITTSKQQVILSDRMWDILEQNGVKDAISALRARWSKESKTHTKTVEDDRRVGGENPRPSEQAMKEAEKYSPPPTEMVSQEQAKKGQKNLEDKAKRTANETGIHFETVKAQYELEAQSRPYKVLFEDVPGGLYYRIEQFGGQKRLYINREHGFYTELYAHEDTSAHARYGLEALLLTLGTNELTSKKEIRLFYEMERVRWSSRLGAALAHISEWDGADDAEQTAQDLETLTKMKS
jgi:hypothetical protein